MKAMIPDKANVCLIITMDRDILFYEIRNSNHAIQLQISMFFAHAILFSNFCKMFPSFNKLYVIFLNLRIHQSKQVTFLTLKK